MKAIIKACEEGEIDGEVVVVGADNAESMGLEIAKEKEIQSFVVNYQEIIDNFECMSVPRDFDFREVMKAQSIFKDPTDHLQSMVRKFIESRAIAEKELWEKLEPYNLDLLVLAGYMRILTPYFIWKMNKGGEKRIMNIHPALLPSFPGMHGYEDTFNYGCKIGGCTVHFVDSGKDTGPIIGQLSFEISPKDTLEDVKRKGLKHEHVLYPTCIQLFAQDRLRVVERKGRKIVEIA